MGKQVLLIAIMILMLQSSAVICSPASVGSLFADTYLGFAPLQLLYESYFNYLFSGTDLTVQPQAAQSCVSLINNLEKLQIEIATQTDSQRVEQLASLAGLRLRTISFCQSYSSTITAISSLSSPELEVFRQAAKDGFFAAISRENEELEHVFSSALETYTNRSRWEFAVAFSTRTTLSQQEIYQLDTSLSEILLGTEDTPYPPGTIPEAIRPQVEELALLSKEGIEPAQSSKVFDLASQIYNWLIGK